MEACRDWVARDGGGIVHCIRFMEDPHYRIVVQRTKVEDGEPDLFGERYVYRRIITNDWDSDEKSIIETYKRRGARERDLARLKNDFGWETYHALS